MIRNKSDHCIKKRANKPNAHIVNAKPKAYD
uniref:Uncharacterized protein n=1 Tax=Arundo donax TaxID=35708 RepID=A0A0A9C175_ARUDO